MKETVLSNCERNFVNKAISFDTRLDGRKFLEARPVKIYFGSSWGSCFVTLGRTKVFAQVSCDIQAPLGSRPNEGTLHIYVNLSSFIAVQSETSKQSEVTALINRQIEKCIKDSKCVDLESLCIVADKKVWDIRVDINIINHDGNLIDCASIAAITALSHFHRPDVTCDGEEVTIHSFSERDPLPLTIYHYPVCVSFIVFENGHTVIDPTYLEERVGVAQLTMGINSYREVCCLHFDYLIETTLAVDVIPTVSDFAAYYASQLTSLIKEVVQKDIKARYAKLENEGGLTFKDCITQDKVTALKAEKIIIQLSAWHTGIMPKVPVLDESMDEGEESDDVKMDMDSEEVIVKTGEGSAELFEDKSKMIGMGGFNTWHSSDSEDDDDPGIKDVEIVQVSKAKKRVLDDIELSGDSEEETTTTISTKDLE